ncbi:MAG TPA: hypothetical protein VGA36_02670 [Nitriliruptorales bacterium]
MVGSKQRIAAFVAVVGLVAAGCGDSEPATTDLPFEAPSGVNPSILEPLLAMGPCPSPPAAADVELPEGLVLPDNAIVTDVTSTGETTTVQGWIDWTPVQLRVHYQHREGRVTVLKSEDEVFEAEILADTADGHRLFVKSQAACESGSVLIAVVAPPEAADQVPEPAGGS